MVVTRSQGCKAHIPVVDHMLKKPHLSDCCYKKNGDFNPTYHDWLGEGERERDRERDRERMMIIVNDGLNK